MPNTLATLTRQSCLVYRITNDDEDDQVGYIISKLNDTGTYDIIVTSSPIAIAAYGEYTFIDDGVYKIQLGTYQVSTGTYIKLDDYVVVIDCAVTTCKVNYIRSLICNPPDCSDCTEYFNKKLYLYNNLMTVWNVYTLQLGDIYVQNENYPLIDDTDITALTDISELLTQMTAYCECLSFLEDSEDCGCS